jgi:NADP-dependent aldehyde dehydrogenase
MGSVNPVVVLPGAIKARGDAVAEGLVNSVTLGSGQFCTNPGLVFVQDTPDARGFVERVRRLMSERDSGVLLNANVERGLVQSVSQTTQRPGVGRPAVSGRANGVPLFNTLLQTDAAAFRADRPLQTEHFGASHTARHMPVMEDLVRSVDLR